METKTCIECGIEKKLDEYHKVRSDSNERRNKCKVCGNNQHKKWFDNNKESRDSYIKNWKNENKGQVKKYNKTYREKNKEYLSVKKKEYKRDGKYVKNRVMRDPLFKLKLRIRSLIWNSIIYRRNYTKKSKTADILGCDYKFFKEYIESQWEVWMTWENYGLYNSENNYGWDLDHKIPIASANSEEDVYKLNHYTNFRPLCSYKNRVLKRGNLEWDE